MSSVAEGESVFYACQAAREAIVDRARSPEWLILGDEEWYRLIGELSAFHGVDTSRLTEFQGMHVVHYAVPSHLEVIQHAEG